jgi:MoxR-like ATPase
MEALKQELRRAGYEARRPELLAICAMEQQADGARVALLDGAPGTGKTALAQAYATARGADYIYTLLHAWSDDQEMFRGIDVAAAVAGDHARVHQPGVLAVAADATHRGPVVLCLDEIDKAPERVEGLLLDVLQTGRVPVRPGEHLSADLGNLVVMVTSNATRPLGDALLRRCRRVRMQPLAVALLDEIVAARTGISAGIVTIAGKAARAVAAGEGNSALSMQEIAQVCQDSWTVAESCDDIREILAQLAARTARGVQAAMKTPHAAALWGEIQAHRRRERCAAI